MRHSGQTLCKSRGCGAVGGSQERRSPKAIGRDSGAGIRTSKLVVERKSPVFLGGGFFLRGLKPKEKTQQERPRKGAFKPGQDGLRATEKGSAAENGVGGTGARPILRSLKPLLARGLVDTPVDFGPRLPNSRSDRSGTTGVFATRLRAALPFPSSSVFLSCWCADMLWDPLSCVVRFVALVPGGKVFGCGGARGFGDPMGSARRVHGLQRPFGPRPHHGLRPTHGMR